MSCVTRSGKNFSSRLRCLLQRKVEFCSKSDDAPKESKLHQLLEASSPLQPTPQAEKFWATSPYPKGTIFGDAELCDNATFSQAPPPEQTAIVMFPGQGNQFVGMAKNLIKYPVVKDMFAAASEILGYNLLKLCLEGPEEKLNETEYCQPATLVCSLAALEKLKEEKPWAVNHCVAACGFSLGEMSALVFAGCFNFERAVKLVKLRAEAMQLCSKMTPTGMLTVLVGPGSNLKKALADARDHCTANGIEDVHCTVATDLFPGCKVIAGHAEALNFIVNNSKEYKLRKLSKLPVSGAFHTDYMKEAAVPFKKALNKVDIKEPIIKVYSNLTGKPYFNADDIRRKLPKQIYMNVKWEQTMTDIFDRAKGTKFPFAYECGPGNSLSVVLGKINNKAVQGCYSVKL